MALAEMQKVHMAMHRSVSAQVMAKIQELGVCHFLKQVTDDTSTPLQLTGGALSSVESDLKKVDDLLGEIRFVSRFVEPYVTEKTSALSGIFGDVPEYSLNQLSDLTSEDNFRQLALELRQLEKRYSDVHSRIARLQGLATQLESFVSLPFPLELFNDGTETVQALLVLVKDEAITNIKSALSSATGDCVEFSLPLNTSKENEKLLAALYLREFHENVTATLLDFSVTRVDVPEQTCRSAAEELKAIVQEITLHQKEAEEILDLIKAHANEADKRSKLANDFWSMRRDQLEALMCGEDTAQTVLIQFWMPKLSVPVMQRNISAWADSCETFILDPIKGERVPTLLQNASWAEPIEPLTLMYGVPVYGGVDPTPLMTPFFYLFFGMCFGDAGYGLLLTGILGYFILSKRMPPTARKLFTVMAMGAVASVVFGMITNSWFGDSLDAFPFLSFLKPLKSFQILNPMEDPIQLLGISLFLGVVQIYAGLLIAMKEAVKKGEYLVAFADQGGWMILLGGLIGMLLANGEMIPGTLFSLFKIISILGALILIFTQGRSKEGIFSKLFSGVMSLYNVTGFLGDILSYSRLLALGLGSATVGMVINLLANLVADIPKIGIFLAVIVFVVGHVFSIAVNILGAFVHSLRLQYVEFLGKFLDATGMDFQPLALKPKHVRLVEEKLS